MDFGALPPEINSGRMYAGPGSAPMVAAASAWNGLAAELNSSAMAYDTQITALTSEEWLGPASAAMAQAATPYVAWMSTTATQAEQAAGQATAAAAAFETAFAAMVPPQLIAENRALLAQAVTTNAFGQNTNVIAALEAQYGEMWAQDATVMYQYAGSSASAAAVTPFASPPQIANPAAAALQTITSTAAANTSLNDVFVNAINGINTALTKLANPAMDPTFAPWLNLLGLPTLSATTSNFLTFPASSLDGSIASGLGGSNVVNPAWFVGMFRNFAGPVYNIEGLPYFSTGMANTMLALNKGLAPAAATAGGAAAAAGHGLGNAAGVLGGGAGGPIAALGEGASVGKLSVPAAWSGAGPALSHVAAPLPISSVSAAPDASGPGSLLGGLPLAGGMGGAGGPSPRYGFRPTVIVRPPFAG